MTRREGDRVREVYSEGSAVWACYARTGGQCFKPNHVFCPCDGWEPFMLSWRGIAQTIEGQLHDDIEDRPEWLKPRPPAPRAIADLLETCIECAETEGQISDEECQSLRDWFKTNWRDAKADEYRMEDGWSPFAGRDE